MDIAQTKAEHGSPEQLERYAFLWSLVRMVLAALALLLGGIPPVLKLVGMHSYGTVGSLLQLCWIVSGVAAVYLLYLWMQNDRKVFGGTDTKDTVAFFVMVVSGINLGLAGLNMGNIGMSIFNDKLFFLIGAVIYIVAIFHLYTRWKASGERLFPQGASVAPSSEQKTAPSQVTEPSSRADTEQT